MHIAFLAIQNCRKLKAIHVDLHPERTLFVGANNSGKTSAMLCLGHFLIQPRRFKTDDFTLSNWSVINAVAQKWANADLEAGAQAANTDEFAFALPTLDIWMQIEPHEVHYVWDLLPTLDWAGGLLGVRLRYAPKDIQLLREDYRHAFKAAQAAKRGVRNHADLKDDRTLRTQMVVSTHSSHVAHETDFACLRYFRRRPADMVVPIPTATVINLSDVFGPEDETARFVARYLNATHADLFFADAAIFVEGSAEAILLPHFIRERFRKLNQCYLTSLEVGGSHAHLFRRLIQALGLTTLVVADLDAVDPGTRRAAVPRRGAKLLTSNQTLKQWLPEEESVDTLLDVSDERKVKTYDDSFAVRVSYQQPIKVRILETAADEEVCGRTFEDALILENLPLFRTLSSRGSVGKVNRLVTDATTGAEIANGLFELLQSLSKVSFALDLLFERELAQIKVPRYIAEALTWLEQQLQRKEDSPLVSGADSSAVTPS